MPPTGLTAASSTASSVRRRSRLGAALALASLLSACSQADEAAPETIGVDLAYTDVRLFDGERVLEEVTVLVDDGEIVAIGAEVDVPEGTGDVIEGRGRTLLPGLIDAHVHMADRPMLEQALVFGVTTGLDMFTSETFAAQMRQEQADGGANDRADLYAAGFPATAPGGHGTQFNVEIPTLTGPGDADGWVADRAEAGADYLKVVIEPGDDTVGPLPTLDGTTVEAIVDAAHERDLRVVTHVLQRDAARTAIESGSDGLAHMFADVPPDEELVALAVRSDVFVIATLSVIEGETNQSVGNDPDLSPCLPPADLERLSNPYPPLELEAAQQGIEMLHAAGVPIAAGSDAPNPGTAHGASLHRELELLTESGLTPLEALAAATSVPARLFGLDDRGRVAEGRRADLVLVEGDPTEDILATRRIVGVWKAGIRADRASCEE